MSELLGVSAVDSPGLAGVEERGQSVETQVSRCCCGKSSPARISSQLNPLWLCLLFSFICLRYYIGRDSAIVVNIVSHADDE